MKNPLALLSVGGNMVVGHKGFKQEQLELIRRYTTFGEWRLEFDPAATLERRVHGFLSVEWWFHGGS